jgi:hypothetical protein
MKSVFNTLGNNALRGLRIGKEQRQLAVQVV